MLRNKATLFALTTLLLSSSAFAADINGKSLKDDSFGEPINRVDFSGFYVGVGAGAEFATMELGGGAFDGIGADGWVGEAVLGYDIRRGSFVFGPRVVAGISNVNTTIGSTDLVNLDAYANFGGRAGIVFNRTLVYLHGGYEMMWASSDIGALDSALNDLDLNAATVGLGLETMFGNGVSLTLEGTYVSGLDDAEDIEGVRTTARINYRF
jgi:hypothetical protein